MASTPSETRTAFCHWLLVITVTLVSAIAIATAQSTDNADVNVTSEAGLSQSLRDLAQQIRHVLVALGPVPAQDEDVGNGDAVNRVELSQSLRDLAQQIRQALVALRPVAPQGDGSNGTATAPPDPVGGIKR